jgi:hypothetical protein
VASFRIESGLTSPSNRVNHTSGVKDQIEGLSATIKKIRGVKMNIDQ